MNEEKRAHTVEDQQGGHAAGRVVLYIQYTSTWYLVYITGDYSKYLVGPIYIYMVDTKTYLVHYISGMFITWYVRCSSVNKGGIQHYERCG